MPGIKVMPWPSITLAAWSRAIWLRPLATVRIRLPWTRTSPGNGSAPDESSTITSVSRIDPISASLEGAACGAHPPIIAPRIALPPPTVNGRAGSRPLAGYDTARAGPAVAHGEPEHDHRQRHRRPPAGEHGADQADLAQGAGDTAGDQQRETHGDSGHEHRRYRRGPAEPPDQGERQHHQEHRHERTRQALVQPGQVGLAGAKPVAAGGNDIFQLAEPEFARWPGEQLDSSDVDRPGPVERRDPAGFPAGDDRARDLRQTPAARNDGGRRRVNPLGQDAVRAATEDRDVAHLAHRDRVRRQPDDIGAAAQPVIVPGLT